MNYKRILKFSFLIFLIGIASQSFAAKPKKENFALVISGGISLGVYEAGMNWLLSEYAYRNEDTVNLKSLTGASAGAVNTIFTAVRKCIDDDRLEKYGLGEYNYKDLENNPFALGWRELDISEMISRSEEEYDQFRFPPGADPKSKDYRDGIVNRKVFDKVLTALEKIIKAPVFRDKINGRDCSVNIGMPVTRDEPVEFPVDNASSESSIKMQRFSIPVIAEVKNNRLKFRNNIEYAENSPGYGYIYLPEDGNGYVAFKDVVRAALTSSAFPVAFGRVKLQYCIRNGASANHADDIKLVCPKEHHGEMYTFVDGGIFDNIPLGLAVDLTECTNPKKSDDNIYCPGNRNYGKRPFVGYVFMDPDRRRNAKELKVKKKRVSDDYDLKNQLSFFAGSVEVARKDELYSTIVRDFSEKPSNNQRSLLITRRYPPITAKYLNYFGAFLSKAFRDYDYYAGIYDGVINVALYQYRKETAKRKEIAKRKKTPIDYQNFGREIIESIGRSARAIVKDLGIMKNDRAFQVFTMLAVNEFELDKKEYAAWQWLKTSQPKNNEYTYQQNFDYKLYQLLHKLETENNGTADDSKGEFTRFLEGLQRIKEENPDNHAIVKLYDKDEFLKHVDEIKITMNQITKRVLSRLESLEDKSKDGSPFIMNMASLVVDARNEVHDLNTWKPNSTGRDKSFLWWLLPNELSADVMQTGLVLTYGRFVFNDYSKISIFGKHAYGYWEFEGLRYHWVRDTTGREDFVSTGINYRFAYKGAISSSGIGYRYYYNVDTDNPELDNNGMHGFAINLGLLADKLRIGFEYRFIDEDKKDEKYLLTLGISDFGGSISSLAD